MTVRDEANLTDVIARSWCDGYRAAKDPNKENVIPDFLAEAEGDLGARSTAYTAKAINYYGYRGDVTLENALSELPRDPQDGDALWLTRAANGLMQVYYAQDQTVEELEWTRKTAEYLQEMAKR